MKNYEILRAVFWFVSVTFVYVLHANQKAFTEGIVSHLLFVFQHLVLFDIYTVHYEI